jgi:LmbE family N-acetylglucosaminyl deacetylase
LRAVAVAEPDPGEPLLVLGGGTIGLCTLLAAQERRVDPVYVTDVAAHKLEMIARLGGHPLDSLSADLPAVARTLARLVESERAEAVVGYDADGIYGHPDHVAVHLLARHAAALTGVTAYDATVDREHLHFAGAHVLDDAVKPTSRPTYGRVTAEIPVAIAATPAELAVKREALLAHASQITPEMLSDRFTETYELEWYLRHGPAGVLEELGNAHALV